MDQELLDEAYQTSATMDSPSFLEFPVEGEAIQKESSSVQNPKQGILQSQSHRVLELSGARTFSAHTPGESQL